MPDKTAPEQMSSENINALAAAIIDTLKERTPGIATGLAVLQLVIANVIYEVPGPLAERLDTLTLLARQTGEILVMAEAAKALPEDEGSVH
jgi:hypothetical protein